MSIALPTQFFEAPFKPGQPAAVDFSRPKGEAALLAPDSVSWRIYKNPVALFVGGVAAVILELAEPRVRSGIWDHTSFRTDPRPRMTRTAMAAMATIYGPRAATEAMIAGVGKLHAKVRGATPKGEPYHALNPELLDWVQATAAFSFLEAYHRYARPIAPGDRDRFYAEGQPVAALYGATGAPRSEAELDAKFQAMRPSLERSPIVQEFLGVMIQTPILPLALRPLQRAAVHAAVEIVPPWAREILGLGRGDGLRPAEARIVRALGSMSDRVMVRNAPPAQACVRLGLPPDYLYRRKS